MVETLALAAFFEASVRLGVPLALAALGETVTERIGVINIGLEGSLIAGALGAALGALAFGSAPVGVLAGGAARWRWRRCSPSSWWGSTRTRSLPARR